MAYWDDLPDDIINIIFNYRKMLTCQEPIIIKIQSIWKSYRTRILIQRFKMLRYLKEFRVWNPNIQTFLLRSFL